jgi:hypothetical protein
MVSSTLICALTASSSSPVYSAARASDTSCSLARTSSSGPRISSNTSSVVLAASLALALVCGLAPPAPVCDVEPRGAAAVAVCAPRAPSPLPLEKAKRRPSRSRRPTGTGAPNAAGIIIGP